MAIQVPGEASAQPSPAEPAAPTETAQTVRTPAIDPQPQPTRGPAFEKPDTEVQVQLEPKAVPTGNIPAQSANARTEARQTFDINAAEAMRSIDQTKKTLIQSSMASVASESPDAAARAATIAAKLRLPQGVVSRNLSMFEKQVRSEGTDYDAIVKRFPATGNFIENPDHAAVVSDDIEALQRVEQVAKNGSTFSRLSAYMKSAGANFAGSLARLPGTALQIGLVDNARGHAAGINPLYASSSDYVEAEMEGRIKPAVKVPDDWINNPAARYFDKVQENAAAEYPEISTDIIGAIRSGNYKDAGAGLLAQVIVNAPQSLALLGAAATGLGLPALAATGALSGADAMGEAVDAGVTPEQATSYAISSGVAEAAMESLPIGLFKHWEGVISKSVGKESSRRIFTDLFKTLISSGVGEAGEEVATSVAQDAAGYLTGVKKDLTFEQFMSNAVNAGLVGGFSGAAITAPSAAISGTARAQIARSQAIQERQAIVSRETYLDMGKAATETRLVDRQPAMNEKFLAEVTKQNGLEKVFIPVEAFETYFQSKGIDPAQMALALGASKTLDESKETGAPLEIPYAPFLNTIGKSEHYAGLQNDVKFSNDALTVNEAKFEKETIAKDVAAEDKKAAAEPDQIRSVEREIEKKLKEANLNPKAAAAFRGIAVLALREGKDPAKAIEELGLRINKVDGKLSDADFSDTEKAYFQREGLDYKNIGGNILDASSMFGKQAKEEAAPVEGPSGEVVALPQRSPRADSGEPEVPSEVPTEETPAEEVLSPLEKLKARVGGDEKVLGWIDAAQSPEKSAWVKTQNDGFQATPFPNYESKPTGVIGDEGISQPFPQNEAAPLDQLAWADRKYGATLGLIKEHAAEGKSLVINTSSDLVGGSEYIEAMPSDTQVNMFMLTKDDELNRLLFPGNPSMKRQLAAVEALKEAGIRVKQIQPTADSVIETVGLEHAMELLGKDEAGVREQIGRAVGPSLVAAKSYNQTAQNAPAFYSKLERTVAEKMGSSATKEQVNALLKDVKADERKWSGIDVFLEGKEKINKAELQSYLAANALEIKEVTKGGEDLYAITEKRGKAQREFEEASRARAAKRDFLIAKVFESSKSTSEALGIATQIKQNQNDDATVFDIAEQHDADDEALEYAQALRDEAELKEKVDELDALRRGPTPTQYSDKTLPGGENYREVLFTLPESPAVKQEVDKRNVLQAKLKSAGDRHARATDRVIREGGDWRTATEDALAKGYITKEELNLVESLVKELEAQDDIARKAMGSSYRSGHWDEKDVLAFTRIDDRVDADGNKILFVEEIQSDWHQEGRKKGYRGDSEDIETLRQERKDIEARLDKQETPEGRGVALKRVQEITDLIGRGMDQVPDAPFKKTWHEFTLKRLIREAAEKGYDKLAWTTGEQQADRYNLAKEVDHVDVDNMGEKGEGPWRIAAYKNGKIISENQNLQSKELESLLGKDLGAKIIAESGKPTRKGKSTLRYKGDDLKVGGEGMKGFYDKILVDFANKFGKKYGAKVEQTNLSETKAGSEFTIEETSDGMWVIQDENGNTDFDLMESEAEARETLSQYSKTSDAEQLIVHSIEITPELKAAALGEGFPMFQKDDADIKGQIRIGDKEINIDVFEGADMSTLLHEAGHLYLEIMGRMSASENATEQTMSDAKTIAEWVGAESLQSLTVEQHEKFARGFEKYLAEGNAPTATLKKAFARFKAWLVSVYKDLSRLNVDLSPEIREVFDRIIASDAEIGKAEVESGYVPLFSALRMAGLSDAQTKRLVTAQDEAAAEARELLTKKLLEIEKKKLTAEYRAQQKAIQDDILKYLNGTQVYRAISLLQTGRYGDGTEPPAGTPALKLDRKLVDPKKAAVIANKFGNKVFSNETGMGPDVIATALGFNDGADMIDTMVAVLPIDEEAGVRTADQMQALYPDLMEEPTELSAAAMEDVHNNSQSKLYKIELDILAENHKASLKDAIRAVAKRSPSTIEVRTQAETFVGEKSVKDLNPNFYVRAEQKANREAGELLANGDIAGAFEAKRRALLNYEMFKAATTAKQQIEKSLLKFKPIYKKDADLAKSRDMDLVNAARSILGGYELGKKTENPPREYLEKVKQYGGEDQYNGLMNLVLPALEGAGNWKDVSYNKFSEMSDAVNAIWELSRDVKQITVDGKKMDIEKATAELTAQVDSGKTFYATPEFTKDKEDWDKTKMKLLGARAALTRVEHWFRAIDGGKSGAFTKIMFQPVSEGTTKYRERKNVVLKDFRALMESIKDRVSFEPIVAKEIGHTFKDKTTLMMAMLHTGNESNKSKLLRGRGWGDITEDGTLNTTRWDSFVTRMIKEGVLTKAEYDFFQGVWNLMESVKPEAQAAHRSIYGYHFAEITAQKIQTPFGEYQGGYVPAKVDIYESMDAEIRAEREAFDAVNNSSQFPTTGRGFSKTRVDAYAAPLSLDLTLLGGHIDGVLRFAHIEAPVKDVARLNLNKELRSKVGEVDPTIVKNAITPWLQRAASQKVVEPSKTGDMIFFDNFAAFARTSAAMQTMFANVVNTIEQLTGVFVAAAAVKPRHLRDATAGYVTNYKQMTKQMTERSQFMSNTQDSSIYESQEAVKRIVVSQSWVADVQDAAKKHTYFLQSATQNIVNTITWTAAYNQHIEEGKTEVEAVREADSAVRRTQGSNNPEDISAFETGTASKRLFTQFAGYFNMIANLNSSNLLDVSRSVGVKKGAGKLFYVTMMSVSIPAILSSVMRKMWAGGLDEDDDDSYVDDLLSTAFWSQAQYATAMVPWVGQLINAGVNKFNDNFYDDRMSLSPVVSLLESSAGAVKSAYDVVTGEEVTKRDVKDILTAIGFWSATPVGPIGRPVGYLMDVAEGEAEPTGAADFLRGLVSGRKGGSN